MTIEESGVDGIWSNLKNHPKCSHGPTLLFSRRTNEDFKYFYVCSASRDRKLCNFYLEKNEEMTKSKKKLWLEESKKLLQSYNHRKCFIRFNQILNEPPDKRAYCHICEKLIHTDEIAKHDDHEITHNLSYEQMNNPTTLLKPLSNAKKEAQYLFSEKTTLDIVNMIIKLGARAVLCIGTPRIHEFLVKHHEGDINSLLLDFDGRYHNFFGPLNYCWYNLFNHHFFNEVSKEVFKDFLTQNNGRDILLICDPPFGGRVEFMSQTIKAISDLHKKWNNLSSENNLKIIFIFPYFMESIMKFKSNPPGIHGGLADLCMADYKVDYDNHPLFITGSNGRKYGSPVRIFTNIPLNLLELPEADGYKYCKRCLKWVYAENKHCKKCKACTSKDGRRYRHCNKCNRCIKPTWKHCNICQRCVLEKHTCGFKPKSSRNNWQSDSIGDIHGEAEEANKNTTTVDKNNFNERQQLKFKSKRKKDVANSTANIKRRKIQSDLLNAKNQKGNENKMNTDTVEKHSLKKKKLKLIIKSRRTII